VARKVNQGTGTVECGFAGGEIRKKPTKKAEGAAGQMRSPETLRDLGRVGQAGGGGEAGVSGCLPKEAETAKYSLCRAGGRLGGQVIFT